MIKCDICNLFFVRLYITENSIKTLSLNRLYFPLCEEGGGGTYGSVSSLFGHRQRALFS